MSTDNCKSCLFYLDIGGPIGVCRRYPQFQNRSPQEWCGEHSGMLVLPVKEMSEGEPKRRGRPKREVLSDNPITGKVEVLKGDV